MKDLVSREAVIKTVENWMTDSKWADRKESLSPDEVKLLLNDVIGDVREIPGTE